MVLVSCVPKEQLVLRSVRDITVESDSVGKTLLKGVAVFYNPNSIRMTLREINVEVFINGKKSAHADQKLSAKIPANNTFSLPLEVQISLKEFGLLDTLMGLLGGRKYEIRYEGYVRVRVHGMMIKVPIQFKDQIKLRI
jgi:LEA14-like dessication related protein